MSLPHASGRIEFENDVIRYTAVHSQWTIHVDSIRIIGEATNQNGPFADDYFICFATGPELWYEFPFDAIGCDTFLADLGARLGATFQLKLMPSTDFASRLLWPLELAGQPMIQYQPMLRKTVFGRLFGSLQIKQGYSEQVLAALR